MNISLYLCMLKVSPNLIHCDNIQYLLRCSVHIYTWNNHSTFVYLKPSYRCSKEQNQLNRFNYYNDS